MGKIIEMDRQIFFFFFFLCCLATANDKNSIIAAKFENYCNFGLISSETLLLNFGKELFFSIYGSLLVNKTKYLYMINMFWVTFQNEATVILSLSL